jgi:hypothetical protein
MDILELTRRVKNAVRIWADLPDAKVLLDDKLSKFQKNDLEGLRVRVNEEFKGEKGFPITSPEWTLLDPKIVRDVRDEVDKRINGGGK